VIPTRERCAACHRISPVGFHVPNMIWETAVHHRFQHSALCVMCFASQADERLIEWENEIEFFPVSLASHLKFCGAALPAGDRPVAGTG